MVCLTENILPQGVGFSWGAYSQVTGQALPWQVEVRSRAINYEGPKVYSFPADAIPPSCQTALVCLAAKEVLAGLDPAELAQARCEGVAQAERPRCPRPARGGGRVELRRGSGARVKLAPAFNRPDSMPRT